MQLYKKMSLRSWDNSNTILAGWDAWNLGCNFYIAMFLHLITWCCNKRKQHSLYCKLNLRLELKPSDIVITYNFFFSIFCHEEILGTLERRKLQAVQRHCKLVIRITINKHLSKQTTKTVSAKHNTNSKLSKKATHGHNHHSLL